MIPVTARAETGMIGSAATGSGMSHLRATDRVSPILTDHAHPQGGGMSLGWPWQPQFGPISTLAYIIHGAVWPFWELLAW